MFTSIDAVLDKLYRQISRFKGRRRQARKGGAVEEIVEPSEATEEEELGTVVRVKHFDLVPMVQEEAIEQMELLGHSFFVFYNAADDGIQVLYRRQDGNYGLIVPELG